jgi:hypothetical protein
MIHSFEKISFIKTSIWKYFRTFFMRLII